MTHPHENMIQNKQVIPGWNLRRCKFSHANTPRGFFQLQPPPTVRAPSVGENNILWVRSLWMIWIMTSDLRSLRLSCIKRNSWNYSEEEFIDSFLCNLIWVNTDHLSGMHPKIGEQNTWSSIKKKYWLLHLPQARRTNDKMMIFSI